MLLYSAHSVSTSDTSKNLHLPRFDCYTHFPGSFILRLTALSQLNLWICLLCHPTLCTLVYIWTADVITLGIQVNIGHTWNIGEGRLLVLHLKLLQLVLWDWLAGVIRFSFVLVVHQKSRCVASTSSILIGIIDIRTAPSIGIRNPLLHEVALNTFTRDLIFGQLSKLVFSLGCGPVCRLSRASIVIPWTLSKVHIGFGDNHILSIVSPLVFFQIALWDKVLNLGIA